MPTLTEAFPSKFLSASDLQGREVVVKITHVTSEKLGNDQKFICYFAGKQKGLALNKTNFKNIVRITGYDNTDDWTGADICLYEAMVDFQGDSVPAVRIKAPLKAPAARGTQPTARPSSADQGRDDFPGDQPPPRRPAPRDDMDDEIGF